MLKIQLTLCLKQFHPQLLTPLSPVFQSTRNTSVSITPWAKATKSRDALASTLSSFTPLLHPTANVTYLNHCFHPTTP